VSGPGNRAQCSRNSNSGAPGIRLVKFCQEILEPPRTAVGIRARRFHRITNDGKPALEPGVCLRGEIQRGELALRGQQPVAERAGSPRCPAIRPATAGWPRCSPSGSSRTTAPVRTGWPRNASGLITGPVNQDGLRPGPGPWDSCPVTRYG
jgi:hypothetical protein